MFEQYGCDTPVVCIQAWHEAEHLEAELAEHPGDGAAAGAAADDEDVELGERGVADDRRAHENTFPPARVATAAMSPSVSASIGSGSGPGFGVESGASGRST